MVAKGEIYLHKKFIYPAGNIDDKYIIILNKIYKNGDLIFAVPATTNFNKEKNHIGCNHRVFLFLLDANEDFFKVTTALQLALLNYPITYKEFKDLLDTGTIEFRTKLNEDNMNKISKCVKEIRGDINFMFHDYLF